MPDRQEEMVVIKEFCVKFAEVPRSNATTTAQRSNPSWGYERIQGALANLGYTISESTVGNILRAAGVEPSPERMKKSNWMKHGSAEMVYRRCARRDVYAGALWAA